MLFIILFPSKLVFIITMKPGKIIKDVPYLGNNKLCS
jgi:hypothetical protein